MFLYVAKGLAGVPGEHISVYTLIHGLRQAEGDLAARCNGRGRAWTPRAKMEGGAEGEPDGESDPFGLGEVAGERGDEFHY